MDEKIYKYGHLFESNSSCIVAKIQSQYRTIFNDNLKYNPQKDSGFAVNAFKNGLSIWFINHSNFNTDKNRQDKKKKWLNTIVDHDSVIIENYLNANKDFEVDLSNSKRLVFVKSSNNKPYMFLGIYDIWESDLKNKKYIVYKRKFDCFDEGVYKLL